MDTIILQTIKDTGYAVPEGHTVDDLTEELINLLASPDPVLRDDLAYEILVNWIDNDKLYDHDDLRAIGTRMAGNLSTGLGEQDSDSVFLRAFSALILGCVIEADNRNLFLNESEVCAWFALALHYLNAEKDLRGLVAGKGWAHATAHTADLLAMLSGSRYLHSEHLQQFLAAAAQRVTTPVEHIYDALEDDRLAYAVMVALRRNLIELPYLTGWLNRFLETKTNRRSGEAGRSAFSNARLFLRSLYFQLLFGIRTPPWESAPSHQPHLRDSLLPLVLQTIRELDPWFYEK